ncbi:MAG: GH32 C-terminal domain-containing protein [Clostridia bacterium]|nr:GH32 C-terminal domain-containing protein [Clostridia bacterium]
MKLKKSIAVISALCLCTVGLATGCDKSENNGNLAVAYSFEETSGSVTKDAVSKKDYKINYVFNEENADKIFKAPSDPLRRTGVKGKALYMDGFSNSISNRDFKIPSSAITLSAWVAPRVFENLPNYGDSSDAAGNPRLTSVINKGNVEAGEGFLLGYGRLGLWGIQLALHNTETDDEYVVAFYDPVNALPLYEWSHIAVSFDSKSGYIGLFYNGVPSYEAIIPELAETRIIESEDPLYIGRFTNPVEEFGISRQLISGLLDEVKIYNTSLSPKDIREVYSDTDFEGHPTLEWEEIALDSSVYEGDRYRPQYHGLPPAVWMNEPHSPFYYKGKYHVFYQHNPSGPYWSQIRWAHIVSDDMIHWEYVKDAVVPTAGICPEGVWTGGACIGPDGTPWLAITAGTNASSWSGQNVAFAHAADPDDPYLVDWIVEDKVAITQPSDDSQGERDQFRDPFVWYDDGTYYMMVSTSIPGKGGSANVYTSKDMREWESRGYLYECDYNLYPEQGAHWECVVMLPISTKDGSQTKYILFDCPQYTVDGYIVDCYYWIGTFDKVNCRFIPDDHKPQLFDMGYGVYTGQNGFCFLTEEDKAAGKTSYEQGRTVIYAIAQGKDAGTAQNYNAGWAHNFAIPLELRLSDDGREVIREPIKELQSVRQETLYSYSGEGKTADAINSEISSIRGDLLEIRATFTLEPTADIYSGGISVRYNPTVDSQTERTDIFFSNEGVYISRNKSSSLDYVAKNPSRTWNNTSREFSVIILLDRSMLEMYVNGVMSFTTRIYPKYGDSDYLRVFDNSSGIRFTSFDVYRMGSAYSETVTPAYYGNTGNLGD